MVCLVILLGGVRLLGFTPYTVLSPSMTPKYPVGSLVYVKQIDPKDVEVGDDITFVMNEDLVVVTHRVIEVDEASEYFKTQGIANDSPDGSPVYCENIIGKVYFCIPMLGFIASKVTSPIGLIVSLSVIAAWCIIIYIIDIAKKDREEKSAKADKG